MITSAFISKIATQYEPSIELDVRSTMYLTTTIFSIEYCRCDLFKRLSQEEIFINTFKYVELQKYH